MGIKAEDDKEHMNMMKFQTKVVQKVESDLGSSDNSVRDALSQQFGTDQDDDVNSNMNLNLDIDYSQDKTTPRQKSQSAMKSNRQLDQNIF